MASAAVAGSGCRPLSFQVSRIQTFATAGELQRKLATIEAASFTTSVLSFVQVSSTAAVPIGSVDAEAVGEKFNPGLEKNGILVQGPAVQES